MRGWALNLHRRLERQELGSDYHTEKEFRHKFGMHVSAAFFSNIVLRGMTLVLVKLLTMTLLKEEYALYAFWLSFVILSSTFSTGAFSSSLWRFMHRRVVSGNKTGASRLLSASFVGSSALLFSIYVIMAISFQAFGFQLVDDPVYLSTLVVVGALGFLYVLRELLLVVSGTEQNSREILVFSISFGVSAYVVACVAALIYADHMFVLLGLSVGYVMPVLAVLILKVKQYGLSTPDGQDFREILSFGGPNVVISLVTSFVPFFISYLLGQWIGLAEIATLSIALAAAGLFTFVARSPQTAYRAYLVKTYETGTYDEGAKISIKVVEMFLVFSVPAVCLLVLMSPLLVVILSTAEYLDATILIPFTLAHAAMMAFSYFWRIQLDLTEKTHLIGLIYVTSAVALVISCILLIPTEGIVGAGLAMTIQAAVVLVLLFIVGNRLLPIKMNRRFGFGFIASAVAMIAIVVLLTLLGMPVWVSAAGACFVYGIAIDLTGAMKLRKMGGLVRLLLVR